MRGGRTASTRLPWREWNTRRGTDQNGSLRSAFGGTMEFARAIGREACMLSSPDDPRDPATIARARENY